MFASNLMSLLSLVLLISLIFQCKGKDDVFDHNVKRVWKMGYTGKNITIAVVDSGLRFTHKDLTASYDPKLSYDFANNDKYISNSDESGTNCAGIIAGAVGNKICGDGIAFNAKIAGIQVISSSFPNDTVLAQAMFPFHGRGIDIFSNSWGPPDTGFIVQGPGPLTELAFQNGVAKGRNGRGSIYVFSSGKGVVFGDNCAFNGFVNNIQTIAVAALNRNGMPSIKSEQCSAVMTAAVCGNWVTTSAANDKACTTKFGETSCAAAVVSGIIALGLQAKNSLTWREVQHLIVRSSRMDNVHGNVKKTLNKAGFLVSNQVGFGSLDASLFVKNAKKFNQTLPSQLKCEVTVSSVPLTSHTTTFNVSINKLNCKSGIINHLEHVVATFDVDYFKRDVLSAYIQSPSGTLSKVISARSMDSLTSARRFTNLKTLSLHFWGEPSFGSWKISLKNEIPFLGLARVRKV